MDYLKIYNDVYNKEFEKCKQITIEKFNKAKEERRPFNNIANAMRTEFYDNGDHYASQLRKNANTCFNEFHNRLCNRTGTEEEIMSMILQHEVLEAFQQGGTSYSNYEILIADLAVHECSKVVKRHFHNYYDYYELIYELDRYEYFYLKDFEVGTLKSSLEYNEMMDKKYPDRLILIKKPSVEIDNKAKMDNNEVISKSKEAKTIKKLSNFNDDEIFLLIKVLYDLISSEISDPSINRPSIPLSTFIKLIKTAGSFDNHSIFYQESKVNTPYQKVNKGIDYHKGPKRLELIESLLSKIDGFKLGGIAKELEKMKTFELK